MGMTNQRETRRHMKAGQQLQPSWSVFHALGEEFAPRLEPYCTYEQIGKEIGTTKQMAYHEAVVALGKLIFNMRKSVREKTCEL